MSKFTKILIASFLFLVSIILIIVSLDFINKKYFFSNSNSVFTCFDNCSQFVCNIASEDKFEFVCMDFDKFSNTETAKKYFDQQKNELMNSNLKNADCFNNKPIIYKDCSVLDRVTEINNKVKDYIKY